METMAGEVDITPIPLPPTALEKDDSDPGGGAINAPIHPKKPFPP